MNEQDSRYLALWKRMERVVLGFQAKQDEQTAQYFVADFFLCFSDIEELSRHVEDAEAALHEAG